jgi:hypothetical protein
MLVAVIIRALQLHNILQLQVLYKLNSSSNIQAAACNAIYCIQPLK